MAYHVTGIITESFTNSVWTCRVYNYITGALIASQTVTGSTFDIPTPNADSVTVVISPEACQRWVSGSIVSIDDLYHPSNPKETPYYFKCITAGTTDTIEPAWNIGASLTTNDGGILWEMVEELINPAICSPVIPSLVI